MRYLGSRNRGGAIVLAAALTAAGCAAEVAVEPGEPLEAESLEEADVAALEQHLVNGAVLPDENYTGIVALQVFSTTLNDYFTFCSGTLMSNTLVITAAHCLWYVANRTVYAKMGSQRRTVTVRFPHSSIDVAVLELDSGMLMWNWWLDHYTAAPQLNRWEYRRQTYRGTNASINGKTLYCFAHGGANEANNRQPVLELGSFRATYPSITGLGGIKLVALSGINGVATEDGDSGAGCFDAFSMAGGNLTNVHSATGGFGVPAGEFAYWADLVMYHLATTN